MRLNLQEPPGSGGGSERPRLWLVPRGPSPVFHRLEDPHVPWQRRLLWTVLALLITTLAVVVIVLFAALVKQLYDMADEAGRVEASEAARQEAPEGTIPLSLSDRPPDSVGTQAAPEPQPAAAADEGGGD